MGDKVQATGTVSISLGEHRLMLKTADQITTVSKDAPMPPIELTQAPTDEQINRLVSVTGSLVSKESTGMVVKIGEQVFTVLFKKSAKIEVPDLQPGQTVSITGLLTNGTNGVSILPRTSDDIRLAEVKGASTDDDSSGVKTTTMAPTQDSRLSIFVLAGLLVLGCGGAIYVLIRRRKLKTSGASANIS
jgi:hypothetical protein